MSGMYFIKTGNRTIARADHFRTAEMRAKRLLRAEGDQRQRMKVYRSIDLVATYGWVDGGVQRIENGAATTPNFRVEDGSKRRIGTADTLEKALDKAHRFMEGFGDARRKAKVFQKGKLIAVLQRVNGVVVVDNDFDVEL